MIVQDTLWPGAEPDTEKEQEHILEQILEPRGKVLIYNDDVTPYDFVILTLQKFFNLDPLAAEHVTFVAHTSGIAYVGTYPLTEAQKRVGRAHFAATLEGYPLHFTIEPE